MESQFERDGVDNVLFIESNVDATDVNGTKQAPNTRTRMNRLRDRLPNAGTLPFIIGQGGRTANSGGAPGGTSATAWQDLFNGWIDEAEQVAPTMKVEAWFKRTALNKVTVWVDVENTGTDVFDPWENGGQVGIIAFQRDDPEKVHLHNLMRIIDWLDFEDVVEPGQKVRLEGEFTAEVPTDFGKLQLVAMVEQEHSEVGWETNGAVMGTMGDPPTIDTPDPEPPTMTCTLTSSTPSLTVGGDATVKALVRADGRGASGAEVTVMVDEGPNAGETATFKTDATGESSFTYSGDEAGTDTVSASGSYTADGFPDPIAFDCGTASVEWTAAVEPTPVPTDEPVDPGDPENTIYLPMVISDHELGQ